MQLSFLVFFIYCDSQLSTVTYNLLPRPVCSSLPRGHLLSIFSWTILLFYYPSSVLLCLKWPLWCDIKTPSRVLRLTVEQTTCFYTYTARSECANKTKTLPFRLDLLKKIHCDDINGTLNLEYLDLQRWSLLWTNCTKTLPYL